MFAMRVKNKNKHKQQTKRNEKDFDTPEYAWYIK